ncbi:MAG: hypothetical protein ACI8QS_003170 [Planctomycetota bacterium]
MNSLFLALPEPASIDVFLTDAVLGNPVPMGYLMWRPAGESETCQPGRSIDQDVEPGYFRFSAPVGRVDLSYDDGER